MAAARRKVHGARRVPCVADGASSWGSVQQRKEGGEAMVEPCNHVHRRPRIWGSDGQCLKRGLKDGERGCVANGDERAYVR